MKKTIFGIVIFLIFIFACTTKDGIDPGLVDKGLVFVNTNTDTVSALIYVNYQSTGTRTPDTLELVTGEYVITLYQPGYKTEPDSQVVLVENGQTTDVHFTMQTVNTGSLFINSVPDFADVNVNGVRFGYTPVIVDSLPVGSYTVEINKFGYAGFSQNYTLDLDEGVQINADLTRTYDGRVLVVEHFSNTNCDPCVEMEETYEGMLADNDSIEIISVGYHPPFPSSNDPMYLAAQEENDDRTEHYGILATPSFFLDGSFIFALTPSQLETNLDAGIMSRSAITNTYANLDIGISNCFDHIRGNVRIQALQDLPANATLRIILVEKDVHIDSPGTNGLTDFKNIMRDMYPSANGIELYMTADESQTIPFNMNLQANWTGGVRVVAFIQVGDDGEIIQAAQSLLY